MSGPPAKKARAEIKSATCTGPVNIAVIKYWGKRDEKLLLPINSSLSATLDQAQLRAKTTVATAPTFKGDRIWLNGKEEDVSNKRLQNCIKEVKARARTKGTLTDETDWPIHICSKNNFPTAAGLASSAAGYACLAATLAELYDVKETELSSIARVGSGSACRSMYGGWVRWSMGKADDGVDSLASQVVPAEHWPEMQILILVVNAAKKTVSSSSGMQTSVKTSALLQHRMDVVVPQRMAAIEKAIEAKDFETFGEITMKDSNQFHAICLDTYPPIFYMNDNSKFIVNILSRYNAHSGEVRAAYTFDAGPNCVIYCLKKNVDEILGLVEEYLPNKTAPADGQGFYRGLSDAAPATKISEPLKAAVGASPMEDGIRYVIHTQPGPGPVTLAPEESLLDAAGMPK
jgi:diphosphomevalonate decarboxylase